jgi:hypothetical protein
VNRQAPSLPDAPFEWLKYRDKKLNDKKLKVSAFNFEALRYVEEWMAWKPKQIGTQLNFIFDAHLHQGVTALEREYQLFEEFLKAKATNAENEIKERSEILRIRKSNLQFANAKLARARLFPQIKARGGALAPEAHLVPEALQKEVKVAGDKLKREQAKLDDVQFEAQIYGVEVYNDMVHRKARWRLFEDVLEVQHAKQEFEFRYTKSGSFLMLSKIFKPNTFDYSGKTGWVVRENNESPYAHVDIQAKGANEGQWTSGFYYIKKIDREMSVTLDFKEMDWTVKNNWTKGLDRRIGRSSSPEETPLVIYVPKDVSLELENIKIVGKHLTFIGAGQVKFKGRSEIGSDESTPRDGHESSGEPATTTVIFGKDIVPKFPGNSLFNKVNIQGGASTAIFFCGTKTTGDKYGENWRQVRSSTGSPRITKQVVANQSDKDSRQDVLLGTV